MTETWTLSPDRCFDPDPSQRACARELYALVRDVPIVSPHGHVDPALLADPQATFGTPADLFIIPDHYVFRMLYSQGIALEDLGVPTRDGGPVERDHRRIWQTFAEHFDLFRGTPTGLWLGAELTEVFGVSEKLTGASAQRIYDHIAAQLATPDFAPRALFKRFNIEHLCTTDPATSTLEHHRALHAADWGERVRPTFRPDAVVNLETPGWRAHIERLGERARVDIVNYASFVRALEARRAGFKELGATATDHAALTPHTARLSESESGDIFQRALRGDNRVRLPRRRPHPCREALDRLRRPLLLQNERHEHQRLAREQHLRRHAVSAVLIDHAVGLRILFRRQQQVPRVSGVALRDVPIVETLYPIR